MMKILSLYLSLERIVRHLFLSRKVIGVNGSIGW